jgi:benzodiazapine receptor
MMVTAMDFSSIASLAVFLAANFATAPAGAVFKPGDWYEGLNHPSWRPPNWLFGAVWTVLYVMIAVSGWLVWETAGWAGGKVALIVYAVHLILNFAWSAVFFGMRRIDLAFAEVLILWISIVATMALFHAISPLAAYLLIPYLCWASFAAVLNYTVWQLNKPAPF